MDKAIYVTQSSMPAFDEYIEMIRPLWNSVRLTNMGPYHQQLETELSGFLDAENLSLMSNGHMALELAIQAMSLTGEVITTPFTFISTTHSIVRNGLSPIFCDINMDDYTMDVSRIEELITEKTTAIVPVHVYGNVCNVDEIDRIAKKYRLKVIYDAAHAFGVKINNRGVANYGDASIFSFHATKVFNTIEGGAVAFHNKEVGEKLYNLKNFGIRSEELVVDIGANAKMNEFQAAMGLCNLRHIDTEIKKRKKVVEYYKEILKDTPGIRLPDIQPGVTTNYSYFPILIDKNETGYDRDCLYDTLKENNIYSRKYFYPLTSDQACFKNHYKNIPIPNARYVSKNILTLPLYADLPLEAVEQICEIVKGKK